MRNNRDRMLIGSIILFGILLLGVALFFIGEPLIEFVLLIAKYVLYWFIGALIVITFLLVAYMTFSRSKTAKELFEALINKFD